MEYECEVEGRRVEVSYPGGDGRGQVGHVRERDRCDAERVDVIAHGRERAHDRLDDEMVFAGVLRGMYELIGVWPGAGHRPGGHVLGDPTYQQFRARTDEPVVDVDDAVGLRRVQRAGDRANVERLARVDDDLACEDDLLDGARVDECEDGRHVRLPGVGVRDLGDGVARRRCRPGSRP